MFPIIYIMGGSQIGIRAHSAALRPRPGRTTAPLIPTYVQCLRAIDAGLTNPVVTRAAECQHTNRIIGFICPFLPPRIFVKCPLIRMGIENNTGRNLRRLRGMRRNIKSLKRNKGEGRGIHYEECPSLFFIDLCLDDHGSFVIFRSAQSDPDISSIITSTMITSSNSLCRERDAP
jgi:hypothetical protein